MAFLLGSFTEGIGKGFNMVNQALEDYETFKDKQLQREGAAKTRKADEERQAAEKAAKVGKTPQSAGGAPSDTGAGPVEAPAAAPTPEEMNKPPERPDREVKSKPAGSATPAAAASGATGAAPEGQQETVMPSPTDTPSAPTTVPPATTAMPSPASVGAANAIASGFDRRRGQEDATLLPQATTPIIANAVVPEGGTAGSRAVASALGGNSLMKEQPSTVAGPPATLGSGIYTTPSTTQQIVSDRDQQDRELAASGQAPTSFGQAVGSWWGQRPAVIPGRPAGSRAMQLAPPAPPSYLPPTTMIGGALPSVPMRGGDVPRRSPDMVYDPATGQWRAR